MTQNAKNAKTPKMQIVKTGEFMQKYFQAFSFIFKIIPMKI
jgi:hypothetical protein